jgi:MFS family permease
MSDRAAETSTTTHSSSVTAGGAAADDRRSHSVRTMDHQSLSYARWQGAFWALMFGAGESSFGIFGTFLNAPAFFFGLLAALPQLAPLMQLVSANLLDRYPKRKTFVLISVVGHVVAYVPLALLAFADPGWTTYGIMLGVLAIYYCSGHFGSPPWTSFISDIVPASRRGEIFAKIGFVSSALTLTSMLSVAGILYLGDKHWPGNTAWLFAGIFIFAGCSRFICFLCITRMREPKYVPKPESAFTFWQFIRRARESNFVKFVVFVAILHGTANIAGPYFLPYCRYDLKFESWQWICINSSATLATIASLMFWGRFADRFGNKRTLTYCAIIIAIQPAWWLFVDDFLLLVLINTCSGVSWGGFNLAMGNYIMEACSPPVRARCVAYFNILLGVGVFCGSMVGSYLLKILPRHTDLFGYNIDVATTFTWLLVISTLLRSLTVLIFLPLFKELRDVHPFSFKEWLFDNVQSRMSGGLRLIPFAGSSDDDDEEEEDKKKEEPKKP